MARNVKDQKTCVEYIDSEDKISAEWDRGKATISISIGAESLCECGWFGNELTPDQAIHFGRRVIEIGERAAAAIAKAEGTK